VQTEHQKRRSYSDRGMRGLTLCAGHSHRNHNEAADERPDDYCRNRRNQPTA
jgi:hypothetical protein